MFSNILVRGACSAVCICSCWRFCGRCASVEDVSFHDFSIDSDRPFNVTDVVSPGASLPERISCHLQGIDFRHWRGRASRSGNILARCGGKISDVVLDDFRLEFHGKNEKGTPEGSSWYDGSPVFNSAVSLSCVENITLRNIAFKRGSDAENWQYQLLSGQCRGLQIDGIPCPEDCRRTFPD